MRTIIRRRKYGLTGFVEDATSGGTPALIGGGSALGVATLARAFAPSGSFVEVHAGLVGALAGATVSVASRKGGLALFAALLVGGAIELVDFITKLRAEG